MAGGTPDSTDTRFEDLKFVQDFLSYFDFIIVVVKLRIRIVHPHLCQLAYNNITLSLLKRFLAVIYNIIC